MDEEFVGFHSLQRKHAGYAEGTQVKFVSRSGTKVKFQLRNESWRTFTVEDSVARELLKRVGAKPRRH